MQSPDPRDHRLPEAGAPAPQLRGDAMPSPADTSSPTGSSPTAVLSTDEVHADIRDGRRHS
ncbi:hypothetical protein [Streptomyces genisteinicus]|uniref:Uncharacterized protein n=1 Tax=Streptomyces genisteinicus TaxID=2768068 RepID=A0A7H0HWG9_9ACTN|nr:hypothetical protein [Streptomyces genisteinicus]QNP64885.1 hypothetical protein IAG43_19505 [Streptomyces genisteinicus]